MKRESPLRTQPDCAGRARDRFLKLPHELLARALKSDLNGGEWSVLLLICSWTLGFKDRRECHAGLTGLHTNSSLSRQGVAKALSSLQSKGLIRQSRPAGFRSPAYYTLSTPIDCQPQLTLDEPASESTPVDGESTTVDRVSTTVDPQSQLQLTQERNKEKEISSKNDLQRHPLKAPARGIVRSAKDAPRTRSSPTQSKRWILAKDIECSDARFIVQRFEQTKGVKVRLRPSEHQELLSRLDSCDSKLFLQNLASGLEDAKREDVSGRYKIYARPGLLVMETVDHAWSTAKSNGGSV